MRKTSAGAALILTVALMSACAGRPAERATEPSRPDSNDQVCASVSRVNKEYTDHRTAEGKVYAKAMEDGYVGATPQAEVQKAAREYFIAWSDAIRQIAEQSESADLRTALEHYSGALTDIANGTDGPDQETLVTSLQEVDAACGGKLSDASATNT